MRTRSGSSTLRLDGGINFIDTADMYSAGESEEIVGKALAGRRDKVILATKVHAAMSFDPNEQGNSRRWIIQECENSLRRLGTDYIDLYQIHRPDPEVDVDETLAGLTDLIRQGKVRYAGSSTFPASSIVEAQWTAERRQRERFVCEQPPYSLLVRGIETEILPICHKYGMGVIPWSPLAGGWLSGKWRKDGSELGSRRSAMLPDRYDLSKPGNQAKLDAADALAQVADKAGITLDPPGTGVHHQPSGGDVGDHRPPHHGAPREPDRGGGRDPRRRRSWTRSTRSCHPDRTSSPKMPATTRPRSPRPGAVAVLSGTDCSSGVVAACSSASRPR